MAPPICGSCLRIPHDGTFASPQLLLCVDCAKGLKPAQLAKAVLSGLGVAVVIATFMARADQPEKSRIAMLVPNLLSPCVAWFYHQEPALKGPFPIGAEMPPPGAGV